MLNDEVVYRVTSLQTQARNNSRVNVFINDVYRFSIDALLLLDLGIKKGNEYSQQDILRFEQESEYKKLYERSLAYCLIRPRSGKEIRDYLYRKTLDSYTRNGDLKEGVSPVLTERVLSELTKRGYINDETFADFWIENRSIKKGVSLRTLKYELQKKGVSMDVIDTALNKAKRDDKTELMKVIAKHKHRYSDERKLVAYLVGRGFAYDDINWVLKEDITIGD